MGRRPTRLLVSLLLAALLTPLGLVGPAAADPPWAGRWERHRGHRHHHHRPPPYVLNPLPGFHFHLPRVIVPPPMIVYRDAPEPECRELNGYAVIEGRRQPIRGTACLMPDGSWRLMD